MAEIISQAKSTYYLTACLDDVSFFCVARLYLGAVNTEHLEKIPDLTVKNCEAFLSGFAKCFDVTDARDPSNGRNAAAPPSAEVARSVQSLKTALPRCEISVS
jgi:hypothetical protein